VSPPTNEHHNSLPLVFRELPHFGQRNPDSQQVWPYKAAYKAAFGKDATDKEWNSVADLTGLSNELIRLLPDRILKQFPTSRLKDLSNEDLLPLLRAHPEMLGALSSGAVQAGNTRFTLPGAGGQNAVVVGTKGSDGNTLPGAVTGIPVNEDALRTKLAELGKSKLCNLIVDRVPSEAKGIARTACEFLVAKLEGGGSAIPTCALGVSLPRSGSCKCPSGAHKEGIGGPTGTQFKCVCDAGAFRLGSRCIKSGGAAQGTAATQTGRTDTDRPTAGPVSPKKTSTGIKVAVGAGVVGAGLLILPRLFGR